VKRFGRQKDFGLTLGPLIETAARDSSGRPLEIFSRGGGGYEVSSEGVKRFTFYCKRDIVDIPDNDPPRAAPMIPAFFNSGELLLEAAGVEPGRLDLAWTFPPGWSAAAPWPYLEEGHRIPTRASMAHNVICLGGWNLFESQTRHILLKTSFSQQLGGDGRKLNSLCNRVLTALGGIIPLPAGQTLLIAVAHGEDAWTVHRTGDSILMLVPLHFRADDLAGEAESDFLEHLARELLLFYSPVPEGREAALFIEAVSRFAALHVVEESGFRDGRWLRERTARHLDAARSGKFRNEDAPGIAAAFFLDRAMKRVAGSDEGILEFLPGIAGAAASENGINFEELMASLHAFTGFEALPFWMRYISRSGGYSVDSELEKCGLSLRHGRQGLTLTEK
jgi:hypothetical protein